MESFGELFSDSVDVHVDVALLLTLLEELVEDFDPYLAELFLPEFFFVEHEELLDRELESLLELLELVLHVL